MAPAPLRAGSRGQHLARRCRRGRFYPVTTIRVAKRDRFTTLDRRTVNDGRLSFRARGVLLWVLDKPDDWETNSTAIAEAGLEGRDAVRTALNELSALGYLNRQKLQDKAGKWRTEWTMHEVPPTPRNPAPDNRAPVFPAVSNQRLIQNREQKFSTGNGKLPNDIDNDTASCPDCAGSGWREVEHGTVTECDHGGPT